MKANCRLDVVKRMLERVALPDNRSLEPQRVGDITFRVLLHNDLELPLHVGHLAARPLASGYPTWRSPDISNTRCDQTPACSATLLRIAGSSRILGQLSSQPAS